LSKLLSTRLLARCLLSLHGHKICMFTQVEQLGALCMLHLMNQVLHLQVCKLNGTSA